MVSALLNKLKEHRPANYDFTLTSIVSLLLSLYGRTSIYTKNARLITAKIRPITFRETAVFAPALPAEEKALLYGTPCNRKCCPLGIVHLTFDSADSRKARRTKEIKHKE